MRGVHAMSPRSSFYLLFRATSAGEPPGRRSHASNMFLVSRCWVLGSRDSTVNSCIPIGARQKSTDSPQTPLMVTFTSSGTASRLPGCLSRESESCGRQELGRRRGFPHPTKANSGWCTPPVTMTGPEIMYGLIAPIFEMLRRAASRIASFGQRDADSVCLDIDRN